MSVIRLTLQASVRISYIFTLLLEYLNGNLIQKRFITTFFQGTPCAFKGPKLDFQNLLIINNLLKTKLVKIKEYEKTMLNSFF